MSFDFDFKSPTHQGRSLCDSSPSIVSPNTDFEAIQHVNMATAFLQKRNGSLPNAADKDSVDHIEDHKHHLSNLAGSRLPFPLKLYQMLEDAEDQGKIHIVSWLPLGNGFVIHKPEALTDELLPLYFRQTKYRSLTRQVRKLECSCSVALLPATLVHS